MTPAELLRHHVTGAIERGEAVAIAEVRAAEPWYRNFYRHEDCPVDPGIKWTDEWDCMCNDACPACGTKDIEPYDSEELT